MSAPHLKLHLRLAVVGGFALSVSILGCAKIDEAALPDEIDELEQTISGCGVERWSVKTGTDPDVGTVNQSPSSTTLATLIGFPAPASLPANNRVAPHERETFSLQNATLVSYKLESDSDYHLVLSDGSRTMITEIPFPNCVGASSPFAARIQAARAAFDARFHATTTKQIANVTATVTGVGFFDFIHGQDGVAPNGFELHPVLSICFGTNCAASANDFSVAVSPASLTVRRGSSGTYTVSTAVISGSSQSVQLSVSGLPRNVSETFSPASISAGSSSTLRISASSSAGVTTGILTITARGVSATHTATATLSVR